MLRSGQASISWWKFYRKSCPQMPHGKYMQAMSIGNLENMLYKYILPFAG